MTSTLQQVTAALAHTEALLFAEYEKQLLAQYHRIVEQLKADDWDRNIHFAYPRGIWDRRFYAETVQQHNLAASFTEVDSQRMRANQLFEGMNNEPVYVQLRDGNTTRIKAQAKKAAHEALEGFCYKLTGKIESALPTLEDVESISYEGGLDPWGWSFVRVLSDRGTQQTWKTKMIINVSCLGKVFNQWPTRPLS